MHKCSTRRSTAGFWRRHQSLAQVWRVGTVYGLRAACECMSTILPPTRKSSPKRFWSVRACELTTVTENQVLLMAMVIYVINCETMSYEYMNFGSHDWTGSNTWLIWRSYATEMIPTANMTGDGGGVRLVSVQSILSWMRGYP